MPIRRIYSNFLTAEYLIGLTTYLFGNEFANRGAGALIVDGDGLKSERTAPPVPLTGTLPISQNEFTFELLAGAAAGFTMVMSLRPSNPAGDVALTIPLNGFEFISIDYNAAGNILQLQLAFFSGATLVLPANGTGNISQFAFKYDPTNSIVYYSVNGSAVVAAPFTPAVVAFVDHTYFGTGLQHIQYFATYDDTFVVALLPVYSVVGFVPPAPPVPPAPTRLLVNQLQIIPVPHNDGLWI